MTNIEMQERERILKLLSEEDQQKRQAALQKANDEYYDHSSPHYRDNGRYSWAVKSINDYWVGQYENIHPVKNHI